MYCNLLQIYDKVMSQSSHNTANYPSLLVYTATMHTKKKELIVSSIFAWSYFFQVFNGFKILFSIFNSGFSREFSTVWCQKQNTVTAVIQVELLFKPFIGFPYLSALCTLFPAASSLCCHFCIPSFLPTNFITS